VSPGTDLMSVRTRRTARLLQVVQGEQPSILVADQLRSQAGRVRTFTQEIRVPEGELLRRLLAEAGQGDEIEMVVVTRFSDQGYVTWLDEFAKRPSTREER